MAPTGTSSRSGAAPPVPCRVRLRGTVLVDKYKFHSTAVPSFSDVLLQVPGWRIVRFTQEGLESLIAHHPTIYTGVVDRLHLVNSLMEAIAQRIAYQIGELYRHCIESFNIEELMFTASVGSVVLVFAGWVAFIVAAITRRVSVSNPTPIEDCELSESEGYLDLVHVSFRLELPVLLSGRRQPNVYLFTAACSGLGSTVSSMRASAGNIIIQQLSHLRESSTLR